MKTVSLAPINRKPQILTDARLLDALLVEQVDVLMACRGKGLCATCHVFVEQGAERLSPVTPREERTLGRLSVRRNNSRLACQARVQGEGIQVRLPEGMYITERTDLSSLVGKRAEQDILHPLTGQVLAEKGKLITRFFIMKLKGIEHELSALPVDDA